MAFRYNLDRTGQVKSQSGATHQRFGSPTAWNLEAKSMENSTQFIPIHGIPWVCSIFSSGKSRIRTLNSCRLMPGPGQRSGSTTASDFGCFSNMKQPRRNLIASILKHAKSACLGLKHCPRMPCKHLDSTLGKCRGVADRIKLWRFSTLVKRLKRASSVAPQRTTDQVILGQNVGVIPGMFQFH